MRCATRPKKDGALRRHGALPGGFSPSWRYRVPGLIGGRGGKSFFSGLLAKVEENGPASKKMVFGRYRPVRELCIRDWDERTSGREKMNE